MEDIYYYKYIKYKTKYLNLFNDLYGSGTFVTKRLIGTVAKAGAKAITNLGSKLGSKLGSTEEIKKPKKEVVTRTFKDKCEKECKAKCEKNDEKPTKEGLNK